MKKIILSCLLTSLIVLSEPLIGKSSINDSFSITKQEQVIKKMQRKVLTQQHQVLKKILIEMMIFMLKQVGLGVVIIQKK